MKNATRSTFSLFIKWAGLSTLGWIVGVFSSILLIFLYSGSGFNTRVYNFFPPLDAFIGVFVWLPLGLAIGGLQSFQLKQSGIKLSLWILVTTLGWWFISPYFDVDTFDSLQIGPIITLIIIGAILGIIQAFILRKAISRPRLWVLSTTAGVCALIFIQFHFLFPPYSYHATFLESIIYNLFNESNPPLYSFLSTYTEEISILVFPFVGTLTTAFPTGLILATSLGSKLRGKASLASLAAG